MSTVKRIQEICDWLEKVVCPEFKYKIPNGDGKDYSSDIRRGPPKAYAQYLPPDERLKEFSIDDAYPAPSIVVMPSEITRSALQTITEMLLVFTIWEPGVRDPKVDYEVDASKFMSDYSGWEGVMNIMDFTARELVSRKRINNMVIKLNERDEGIEYSLYRYKTLNGDETAPDLWPFFMGMMRFTIYCPTPVNNHKTYEMMI